MGDYVFKLPDIGEGVVEGEIVAWHVKVGDSIKEDDQIVDIMTDKATVTIPSPTDGIVTELSGEVGDMIAVGSALVTFSTDGSSSNNQAQNSPEPEVTLEPVIEEEKKTEPIAKEIKKPAPKPVELITESKVLVP